MRSDWRSARRPTVVEVTKNVRVDWGAWGISPGLKPGRCKIKRSRGFEKPLARTESPGLAQFRRPIRNSEMCRNSWRLSLRESRTRVHNVRSVVGNPGSEREVG